MDRFDPPPEALAQVGAELLAEVRGAMVEIEEPGRLALVALLADGHLLIEDVPGVGKTTLARVMARLIGGHDSRIQCTEDLRAGDVLGREIASDNPAFRPPTLEAGPIFANAVVMDEVNRAPARLQAVVLEAMEERFVTLGTTRHALPRPFFVLATMNPYETGAELHPLPHAQRDRFALRTSLGYPSEAGELDLLERFGGYDVTADVDPIVAPGDIVALQRAVADVPVPAHVRAYVVALVRATRVHPAVRVGASPRAALVLQRCAQALAFVEGDAAVRPEHVRTLLAACLGHRLDLRDAADAGTVCGDVLASVAPPDALRPAPVAPAPAAPSVLDPWSVHRLAG